MPYYRWYGTDEKEQLQHGMLFAVTDRDLKERLLNAQIILLEAFAVINRLPARERFSLFRGRRRLLFIDQLSSLLESGMKIHQALAVIAESAHDVLVCESARAIQQAVYEGAPLCETIRSQPLLADESLVALIAAGERSGNLHEVLRLAHAYYKQVDTFQRRLVSSLTGPFITAVMFFLVALGIFVFVIPRFETIFVSITDELPRSTRVVLSISRGIRAVSGAAVSIFLCLGMVAIFLAKRLRDRLTLMIPFYTKVACARFLHLLGLLTACHISVVSALSVICQVTTQPRIRAALDEASESVVCGTPLSQALSKTIFGYPGLVNMIKISEASGDLAKGVQRAAQQVTLNLQQQVDRVITLLQPMLLLGLGVGVSWLLCALYLPLLTLTSVIK